MGPIRVCSAASPLACSSRAIKSGVGWPGAGIRALAAECSRGVRRGLPSPTPTPTCSGASRACASPLHTLIDAKRSWAARLQTPHLLRFPPLPPPSPPSKFACGCAPKHAPRRLPFTRKFPDELRVASPSTHPDEPLDPPTACCGREFRLRRALEAHARSHGACGKSGCTFAGSRAVLRLHGAWPRSRCHRDARNPRRG